MVVIKSLVKQFKRILLPAREAAGGAFVNLYVVNGAVTEVRNASSIEKSNIESFIFKIS